MPEEGSFKVRSSGDLVWLTRTRQLWPPLALLPTHDLLFLPLFLHLCFLCWETEDLLCTTPQHLPDLNICSHLHSSANLAIEGENSVRACLGPTVYSTALLLFPVPRLRPVRVADGRGGALLVDPHVTSSWDFTSCGCSEAAGGCSLSNHSPTPPSHAKGTRRHLT